MLAALTNLIFFTLLMVGLGIALAPDWSLKAGERLCLGVATALLVLYGVGFGVFVAGLNPAWLWCLPPAIMTVMIWRRQSILVLCRDPETKSLLEHWGIFILWTLGLLALVVSYSGGGWAGDWLEHYHRTLVYMQRESLHMHFIESYTLTSRPPLANVVTALLMEFSSGRFADYQIFTALLSTLFFFPGWLFYQRWRRARGSNALWTIILMLNPLVAQNTTFAWTKLTCTFWLLCGGYFLLRGVLNELGSRERVAGFLCLTAGMITHYSAGPWILTWLVAYAIWCLRHGGLRRHVREAIIITSLCSLLAFTWFGWAGYTFGWQETGTSNSTAQEWKSQTTHDHLLVPINNIVNTIVPHPFREMNTGLIYQLSKGGWVRDYFFNIYQTNLPLAAGFSGLCVLLLSLRDSANSGDKMDPEKRLWRWFIPIIIITGILVHTPPESWGLAHICLQPLVIIGLAWIAACLPKLSTTARISFVLLLLWDTAVGIVLPFLIQAYTFFADELTPAQRWGFEITRLSRSAGLNYVHKTVNSLNFFADTLGAPAFLVAAFLCVLLALIIVRLLRETNRTSHSLHAHS